MRGSVVMYGDGVDVNLWYYTIEISWVCMEDSLVRACHRKAKTRVDADDQGAGPVPQGLAVRTDFRYGKHEGKPIPRSLIAPFEVGGRRPSSGSYGRQ